MEIFVNLKQIGRQRRAVAPVSYQVPDDITTVEGLIAALVASEVADFQAGRSQGQLLPYLDAGQMADQETVGKISVGAVYNEKVPEVEAATQRALQAYADGLVRVFIGDVQQGKGGEPFVLRAGDQVSLIRLTMLAGRMW